MSLAAPSPSCTPPSVDRGGQLGGYLGRGRHGLDLGGDALCGFLVVGCLEDGRDCLGDLVGLELADWEGDSRARRGGTAGVQGLVRGQGVRTMGSPWASAPRIVPAPPTVTTASTSLSSWARG